MNISQLVGESEHTVKMDSTQCSQLVRHFQAHYKSVANMP